MSAAFEGFMVSPDSVSVARGGPILFKPPLGKGLFYGYQPFGQDIGTPTGTETYRFTGKPVSQTTGLYYYGSR